MSKKKKIIIYSIISLLILGAILFILCSHFLVEKEEPIFNGFTFREVTKLNYGDFNLGDFVEEVTCEEKCFFGGKELEYKITNVENLGTQKITVNITYQGKSYEETFEVEVTDEITPVITLSSEEIEIEQNSDFNAESYIVSVTDNYDELTIDNVQIESNVNTKEVGDYTVTYTLNDRSKNKTSSSLIVHVTKKEEDKTNTGNNENKNNSTNNKTDNSTSNKTNNNDNKNTSTSSSFKSAINGVSLSPLTTRYPDLDKKIASIISSVTNSSMSNYEKLQAIYNYVKNKLSYEMMILNLNELWALQDTYSYYDYDGMDVMRAYYSLNTGHGVCDNYAALFMILARRIGFDAYVVGGSVNKVGGGTTGHAWVMIKAGGTYYIFDPQIEDSKKTSYDYFGKTDSELPIYHYNLSSNISKFHYFKENPDLGHSFSLDVKVSGDYTDSDTLNSGSSHSSQFGINLGSSMAIELKPSRTQKYTVEVTSNDTVILNESYDGSSSKVINYTFEKTGIDNLKIIVKTDGYKVEYRLMANVKEIENSNP